MTLFLKIFKFCLSFILLINISKAQNSIPKVLAIENDSSYIYESNLSYKNNNFGGLLITKKKDDKLRVSLSTKFGMKIFDFLLDKDSIHSIYTIEQLDKKIIQKMFYKDFMMIFPFLLDAQKVKEKKDKIIIKNKLRKLKYIYNNGNLIKIKKRLGLTRVEINSDKQKIEELEIIHSLIGLKIKIKPLILLDE